MLGRQTAGGPDPETDVGRWVLSRGIELPDPNVPIYVDRAALSPAARASSAFANGRPQPKSEAPR